MFIKDNTATLPDYIAAADSSMDELRKMGSNDEISGLCFFQTNYKKDNDPTGRVYDYFRAAAWGRKDSIVNNIVYNMESQPAILHIITNSFSSYIFEHVKPEDSNVVKQGLRRALLDFLGKPSDKNTSSPQEDAERIFKLVRAKLSERTAQITALEKYIKDYRKAGLRDIASLMHQEITRLKVEMAEDDAKTENARLEANRKSQQMREALRIKQQRQEEAFEMQRLEHDYDSMGRRVKNYRTMIERLAKEMEQLQQEQRQMEQQHPQFDPHSAAKRKRQQLAERKRERAALKKKGKVTNEGESLSLAESMRRKRV